MVKFVSLSDIISFYGARTRKFSFVLLKKNSGDVAIKIFPLRFSAPLVQEKSYFPTQLPERGVSNVCITVIVAFTVK
jgi:hypothetical protein